MSIIDVLALCCAGLALACLVVRIGCRGWTRAEPESSDTSVRQERRHLTEMGRNWKWPSHINRSAGQKRRWEKAKGNAQ